MIRSKWRRRKTKNSKQLTTIDMYLGKKNIAKNLAVSKEVANIVMRDSDHQIVEYILNVYKKAYPCDPTFGWSLSRKQKGVRPSFYTYLTKLLIQKCETAKKLVGRGITVPALQPYRDGIVFVSSPRYADPSGISGRESLPSILQRECAPLCKRPGRVTAGVRASFPGRASAPRAGACRCRCRSSFLLGKHRCADYRNP